MTQQPSSEGITITGASIRAGDLVIDHHGWHKASQPTPTTGRRAAAAFQPPVKVSQASPIFDGVKLDTTDLDAEEAITRAERAMADGDRTAALAAVQEAEHLLINATVLEKVMTVEGGGQL